MNKLPKIILLLLVFIVLTTYNPTKFSVLPKNFFFKIKNIEITSNVLIETKNIEEKISQIYGTNILFLKRGDVEKLLNSIEFLEKIEVRKRYPNTLIIKIHETKPIAILFDKEEKYFIDSSFKIITFNKNLVFNSMPNIFGEDAKSNFSTFFKKLKNYDFATKRIKNYYYFKIGRWDIQLQNDQIIKFPSENTSEAIQQASELLNREDFKKYNIIDLRMDDKIVVE